MHTTLRQAHCAMFAVAILQGIAAAQTLTAVDAIQRIQQHYAALPPDTVDTVKAGDAHTPVTGIATTFLDTMDVLREANRQGANLVVTHEPTFYNHLDDRASSLKIPCTAISWPSFSNTTWWYSVCMTPSIWFRRTPSLLHLFRRWGGSATRTPAIASSSAFPRLRCWHSRASWQRSTMPGLLESWEIPTWK